MQSGKLIFIEAYFQEFHFAFHDQSSAIIEYSSIEGTYYAHSLNFYDSTTGRVANSDLSKGQLFVEASSAVAVDSSSVLHIRCQDSCRLNIMGSSINEIASAAEFSAVATLTAIKPGYYTDWDLHRDNAIQNWPIDITLLNTTVSNWNFDIGGSATVLFEDCNIGQLAPADQSDVTVRNSTVASPVLFFSQDQTIGLKELKTGYIGHWSLQNLDPEIRRIFIIENSEIINGWYVTTGAADLTIVDSELVRLWAGFDTPTAEARVITSHVKELAPWGHRGTLTFQDTVVDTVANPQNCSSRFGGTVRFANKQPHSFFGSWYNSTITREFPVLVQDSSGSPLPNVELELYSPQGDLIWSGTSDPEGKAVFEIIFDDSNYDKTWTLKAPALGLATEARFLTDTPITLGGAGVPSQGDPNDDGQIDVIDARICLQGALGFITLTDSQKNGCDVNHDDQVTLEDAQLIAQFAIGQISSLATLGMRVLVIALPILLLCTFVLPIRRQRTLIFEWLRRKRGVRS